MKSRQRITYEFTLTEEEYYRLAAALIAGRAVADDDETHRVVDAFIRYLPEEGIAADLPEEALAPSPEPSDDRPVTPVPDDPPSAGRRLFQRLMAR